MTASDIKKILRHPLFAAGDGTLIRDVLSRHGETLDARAGEIILSPTASARRLGLILTGTAEVSPPGNAGGALLRFLCAGDLFGVANLFSDDAFVSVIRAKGTCRVFFLEEDGVRELLERDRDFLYRYLGFLAGRVRFLNRKIGYLTAGSTERRLALCLSASGEKSVTLDHSLSALSDLLAVGRASLYRAFDRLTADGWIVKNGKTVEIPDPEGLRNAYSSESDPKKRTK